MEKTEEEGLQMLKDAIRLNYGTRCDKHMDEIIHRFDAVIAAIMFTDDRGLTPLSRLNKIFKDYNF